MALFLSLLQPFQTLSQSQFAGLYTGIIHIAVGNNPESSAGAVLISVNNTGELTAPGLSGRVDAAGSIAWDTPNALYLTTGSISGATLSSIGSRVNNGLTTTIRLDAKNNSAVAAPTADPILDSIVWVNPTPLGATLQSVIYQSNQFFAVGGGGVVVHSTDGLAWQTRTTPARRMLTALTHGKGLYVAVGEGETIITSPDAQNWTLRGTANVAKFDLAAVAFGNDRFLAVGGVGNSLYSDDGAVWQTRTGTGLPYVDAKFINGKFVILGFNPGGAASVWTSTDGATWSAGSALAPVVPIRGIAFGNGKYLVCGTASDGYSRIFQSTDATAWTMNPSIVAAGATNAIKFNYLNFAEGKFMAFDGSNYSYTSTDGITWQRGKSVTRPPKAIAFGGGRYAAVGETLSTSSDGVSWEDQVLRRQAPHINFVGGKLPNYVYVGQGGFYDRFGVNNSGLGVTNDLYWAASVTRDISDYFMGDGGFLRFNGDDYVVPGRERLRGRFSEELTTGSTSYIYGDAGAIYALKSTVLFTNNTAHTIITNITRLSTPTTADLLGDMVFNNTRFVFGRAGTILRSTSLLYTNWVSVASGTTADLYSGSRPNFPNALAVVVGDQGTILTSPNGLIWTKRVSGTTEKLIHFSYQESDIFQPNRVYTAVGEDGTVLVSKDHGTNWAIVAVNNFGRKLRSVFAPAASSASLMAVGDYGLVASSDHRTNWIQSGLEASFTSAVYGNGRWAVVGPYYCLTSLDGVRWDLHSFKYRGGSMGYGGGRFAVNTTGGILTSPDAINWTESYKGATGVDSGSGAIAYGGGRWAAVGFGIILISADGNTWAPASLKTSGYFTDVRYANGIWVAVGQSGLGAYSLNGIDWTLSNTSAAEQKRALAFGRGLWVYVGDAGRLSTSANGINWTIRNQNNDYKFTDVEFVGDRFIAVGNSSNTNLALVSTNGTNWTSIGLSVQPTINGLAAANGTLLMVGDKGTILQGSYPVTGLPAVSVTPSSDRIVAAGNTISFKATVSGQAPFQFQWSRNGIPLLNNSRISGVTADTLSVVANAEEDGGDYTVEVINSVGSRVSFPVNLSVVAPPSFLTQPLSQVAVAGGTATFIASATGALTTYQWLKDGVAITGATNANLTLSGLTPASAGGYAVTAVNTNGARTSRTATLSVSTPPTFSVDDSFLGRSLTFSNWVGFPNQIWTILPLPAGKRLIGGTFKITRGPSVYTGIARLNADGTLDTSFTPPALAPPSNLNFRGAVRTILPLPDGRFLLGGQSGPLGLTLIQADGTEASPLNLLFLTSAGAPYITSLALQADGKIVMCGSFSLNGVRNHGRLNSDLTLDNTFGIRTTQLVPAEASSIAVQADQRILVGGSGVVRLETTGGRDFNFPQNSTGVTGLLVMPDGRIAMAGQNITMLTASGAVDSTFQANTDGTVMSLDKLPDESLVVGGSFTKINNLSIGQVGLIRKDGTPDPSFKFSLSSGGVAYAVAVEPKGSILVGGTFRSINGVSATNLARILSQPAAVGLVIMSQPRSVSADFGDTVTLSVGASGGAPLAFQWRKDGIAIPNATQSAIVLANVTTNHVANYTVVVTDSSGSLTSQPASLTVAGIAPTTAQTSGYDSWVTSQNLPANARGLADDPDTDRVPNIFEYYFGTNPASATSAATPQGASVRIANDNFPAITFIRTKIATDIVAQVLVSSTVDFTDSLGNAAETVTDLGNGTERVVVLSTVNDRAQPIQFFKLQVTRSIR